MRRFTIVLMILAGLLVAGCGPSQEGNVPLFQAIRSRDLTPNKIRGLDAMLVGFKAADKLTADVAFIHGSGEHFRIQRIKVEKGFLRFPSLEGYIDAMPDGVLRSVLPTDKGEEEVLFSSRSDSVAVVVAPEGLGIISQPLSGTTAPAKDSEALLTRTSIHRSGGHRLPSRSSRGFDIVRLHIEASPDFEGYISDCVVLEPW